MTTAAPHDKLDGILDAAFQTFASYGYRRTAMEDIARAAGLSRSALYLHFKNKEDIFRSLAQRYFDEALRDMETALTRPGQDMAQALLAAFIAKDGKFMEVVLSTPHGQELMDAGFAVTGDLAAAGEGRMTALLAKWLSGRALPPDMGTPDRLAETIVTAVKGLKTTARTLADYREGQALLARLFARALS